jgi:hypothetical protein
MIIAVSLFVISAFYDLLHVLLPVTFYGQLHSITCYILRPATEELGAVSHVNASYVAGLISPGDLSFRRWKRRVWPMFESILPLSVEKFSKMSSSDVIYEVLYILGYTHTAKDTC